MRYALINLRKKLKQNSVAYDKNFYKKWIGKITLQQI
jgi:hypothetical protein